MVSRRTKKRFTLIAAWCVLVISLAIPATVSANQTVVVWSSANTAHADDPTTIVCDESCQTLDTLNFALFLPMLAQSPELAGPPTIVEAQSLWTAEWWQWLDRMGSVPTLEEGAVDCSAGQSDSVWFLAGVADGRPRSRSCTIPLGKTLLVPIFTTIFYNAPGESYSVEEKRTFLDEFYSNDVPGEVNTELCRSEIFINNIPFESVRLVSPTFEALNDPEAIADGIYLAFQPALGINQLHFVGEVCAFGTSNAVYSVDVTYKLNVTDQ